MRASWSTTFRWQASRPGEAAHAAFASLPGRLYAPDSPRFRRGFEPVLRHLVDCHTLLRNGVPVGRFAFYHNPELTFQSQRAAAIGSYECVLETEVAERLFGRMRELAGTRGFDYLIGPMAGSTWQTYRFALAPQQPLVVEPVHHDYYPAQWRAAGFQAIGEYVSKLDRQLHYDAERLGKFRRYFRDKGARLRRLDAARKEEELVTIGAFCNRAFADNFLFTPLPPTVFAQQYQTLGPLLDPELIWLAEDATGALQGLLFALDDPCALPGRRLLIKTVATRPGGRFRGLASYLLLEAYAAAAARGCDTILHTYMHVANASMNSSAKYAAQDWQRYALYGRAV